MKNSVYKIFKSSISPRDLFDVFKDDPAPFLLESSVDVRGMGRYSFLGSEPFLTLQYKDGCAILVQSGKKQVFKTHPLSFLREFIKKYELKGDFAKYPPLLCGAVGFFSYDLGFLIEKIKRKNKPDLIVPEMMFGFYDVVVCIDHWKDEVIVFSSGFPQSGQRRMIRARRRLTEVLDKLKNYSGNYSNSFENNAGFRNISLSSNFKKRDYEAMIRQAQGYIAQGDIYQVNLSQKFKADFRGDDWQLYRRLVKNFPVSFSAFLKTSDFSILSASPEKFLSFDGHSVMTRPMKGTRRRTENRLKNKNYKKDLIESAKEKAELLMIVDLERNDLGRVCDYGSIKVNCLRGIEAYKSVFQATADISGVLHKGKDRCDLIRACFPGGSVTGCPKIRAMEIIEELEPETRSIYTGSLGFLSFHNTMELNVLIRSFLKKKNEISFHVGGGIVSDSKPASEYEETLIKGYALVQALTGINR